MLPVKVTYTTKYYNNVSWINIIVYGALNRPLDFTVHKQPCISIFLAYICMFAVQGSYLHIIEKSYELYINVRVYNSQLRGHSHKRKHYMEIKMQFTIQDMLRCHGKCQELYICRLKLMSTSKKY
jgi:hypothetical protein